MSSTKLPTFARAPTRLSGPQVGEGADARPGLDHGLAQQAVVEDLGAGADLDVDEAHERAHDGARAHDRATLEDREGPQHGTRLDHDIGADERARRVLDAHALRREMLRPAHESVGATSAWNSAPARSGAKSSSRRAWARLAGLAWMADLSALSAAGGVARPGLRGGQAVQRALVPRVDLQGLMEVPDGLGVVPAVVEDDPVVEQLLEGLRPGGPQGAVAHGPVGPGPLDELLLVAVALEQLVEEVAGAVQVLFSQRLDGALEEIERLLVPPVHDRRRNRLLRHASRSQGCEDLRNSAP